MSHHSGLNSQSGASFASSRTLAVSGTGIVRFSYLIYMNKNQILDIFDAKWQE